MALCSESTGKILTFFSFDLSMKIFPAATKVSLLAIARLFPELIAAYAECNPYIPIIPVITMSHLIFAKSIKHN